MSQTLLQDKIFIRTVLKLATPIIIQNFVMATLNIIDIVMIGQLGETAVAAVGLAGQLFFLVITILFGITSGGIIFTAQYWGQQDIANIRKVLGICLILGIGSSGFFSVIALGVPEWVLGIYTTDQAVIALGSDYLRIVGLSYIPTAIMFSYAAILRSTEETKLPMMVNLFALSLNTIMNYGLIFGHFDLPALGVTGAALATCIARYLECICLLLIIYNKKMVVAATLTEMLTGNLDFIKNFFKTTFPVLLNEVAWSSGMTTYNIIYARINTEAIAAVNITATIDQWALILFNGLANAGAIMIGNRLGAKETDKAILYANRYLGVSLGMAILASIILAVNIETILSFYKLSALATHYTENILWVIAD